jgi:hypothetical protein
MQRITNPARRARAYYAVYDNLRPELAALSAKYPSTAFHVFHYPHLGQCGLNWTDANGPSAEEVWAIAKKHNGPLSIFRLFPSRWRADFWDRYGYTSDPGDAA